MRLTWSIKRCPRTYAWMVNAVQWREDRTIAAECTASFRTSAEAHAARPGIINDIEQRTPWGPDIRGPAADRKEIVT